MSYQKPGLKDPFWLFSGLATLLLAGVLLIVNRQDQPDFKRSIADPERTAQMNIRVLP
jgi:hypothetical protein